MECVEIGVDGLLEMFSHEFGLDLSIDMQFQLVRLSVLFHYLSFGFKNIRIFINHSSAMVVQLSPRRYLPKISRIFLCYKERAPLFFAYSSLL